MTRARAIPVFSGASFRRIVIAVSCQLGSWLSHIPTGELRKSNTRYGLLPLLRQPSGRAGVMLQIVLQNVFENYGMFGIAGVLRMLDVVGDHRLDPLFAGFRMNKVVA
jgi:hypothetical protein